MISFLCTRRTFIQAIISLWFSLLSSFVYGAPTFEAFLSPTCPGCEYFRLRVFPLLQSSYFDDGRVMYRERIAILNRWDFLAARVCYAAFLCIPNLDVRGLLRQNKSWVGYRDRDVAESHIFSVLSLSENQESLMRRTLVEKSEEINEMIKEDLYQLSGIEPGAYPVFKMKHYYVEGANEDDLILMIETVLSEKTGGVV